MANAIDCVYKKSQKIKDRLDLIIQHTFMMNIFSNRYRSHPKLKEYLNLYRGEINNQVHNCNKKESRMCGIEQVIEELFYAKEEENRQTHTACLDIGEKLSKQVLIEYQDVSKVTSKFVNELGGDYSISKTTRKEKEKG